MGSVWVGSTGGCAVNVAPADPSYKNKDTITPFGRAFYQGLAPYTVIPIWGIVLYSYTWQAVCTVYVTLLYNQTETVCYCPFWLVQYSLITLCCYQSFLVALTGSTLASVPSQSSSPAI
jgi:hypothetical protein